MKISSPSQILQQPPRVEISQRSTLVYTVDFLAQVERLQLTMLAQYIFFNKEIAAAAQAVFCHSGASLISEVNGIRR
jgi:hypothetical protein